MKELKFYTVFIYLILAINSTLFIFSSCNTDVPIHNTELQQALIASLIKHSTPDKFNEDVVIQSFEQLALTDSICMQFESSYLQAMKSKYGLEEGFAKMDSVLSKVNCPECKINAYTSMGHNYYARGVGDHGASFFKKALQQDKDNSFPDSRMLKIAEASLNGLENLQVGMKHNGFNAADINDRPIDIESTSGKVVVLDFWATWCKPCKEDLPMLQNIYTKYGGRKDFEMFSISTDKSLEILESYLESVDMPWSHIYDGIGLEGQLSRQYNGFILPTYYVIDKDGTIQYNFSSYREGENLEETVDNLLKRKP